MRRSHIAAALALLFLGACSHVDHWVFHDAFGEAHGRAVNAREHRAALKTCDGGPGAEWCKVAADDGSLDRTYPLDLKPQPRGVVYAYDPSQCAGTFDHGLCYGVSRPRVAQPPACHGEMIDGVCSGPVF